MTDAPIVIVGPSDDAHVLGMSERLGALGAEYVTLDAGQFPASLQITLGDRLDDVRINGANIRPSAIYVRNLGAGAHQAAKVSSGTSASDRFQSWLTGRERHDVIASVVCRWEHMGIPVYNGMLSSVRITKPFQLALLREAGLPVPVTRWTNDPMEVCSFARGSRVAYKPVTGGAATRELTADDLKPARLQQLSRSPVTFQNLLPGEDLRVYVLDGEVIAAIQIVTESIDFRGKEDGFILVDLPSDVCQQCVTAAQVIGLRFTGMDLKRDDENTFRFLEVNSSPMFLGFDARAGTDVGGHLARRLVHWQRV